MRARDAGGVQRTMYLKGLPSPSTAFNPSQTTPIDSQVTCSQSPDFSSPKFGNDCMMYQDSRHTYWGNRDWFFNWALFSPYGAHTLRHCGNHGGGRFSPGEIAIAHQ